LNYNGILLQSLEKNWLFSKLLIIIVRSFLVTGHQFDLQGAQKQFITKSHLKNTSRYKFDS
jgi:hypothetical protein